MQTKILCFALFLLIFLTLPLIATAKLTATLEGHTDVVWSVAFSPDGQILASGSWDETIRLWDVDTEQLLHKITATGANEVTSVAFSPDGDRLVGGCWDGTIRLWNPHTAKETKKIADHSGGITSVAFSPDGSLLARGSTDQTIRLWNTATWQVQRTLTGHTDRVNSVAFSSDGLTLASGSYDKTIRLWNPHTGKLKRTLRGHTDAINRVAFSTDGSTLASNSRDGTIRLWDPHTGKTKITLTVQAGWVNPVAFSPDGRTLLIGGHGISVWDTETGQYKVPLTGGIGEVVSVVFSPDGQMAASGGADNKVRLWESIRLDVPFATIPFDINNIPEPQPPPMGIIQFFDLSPFYQQWINVAGFPVIASAKVNPYAVKEAAWVIWQMIGHRKSILKNLGQYRQRLSVLAIDESWGDLPEYEVLDDPLKFLGAPARDVVTSQVTLASEENLLDPDNYSFLIHEFTHQIHNGLRRVGSDFDNRLHATYDMAMKSGLWRGTYAASNHDEYLAEAVGSWFHAPYEANPIKTRAALKAYDLELAELITEIFGDFEWRYTSPATRTHLPHLKGFDPQQRLRSGGPYPWEIRASEIERQLKDPNSDGGGKWVNLKLYPPSQLQTLLKSKTTAARASFIMVNDTGRDISLYVVDANGTTHIRYRSTTRKIYDFNTHVGSIWLIKDHNGEDLAVFRAVARVGRVLVTPALDWMTPNAVEATGLNIPDPSLRAKIEEALGKGSGDTITAADMARLTRLDARNAHISDLTGLQHATNLTELLLGAEWVDAQGDWINSNSVSTLSPLAGLINLTALDLRGNDISDISPLAGLINLTRLSIEDNSVSDLLPLTGLTNLAELKLFGNSITDISPLSGLTNLTWLQLFGNNITDLSPLAGLTNLTRLALAKNGITDISPLSGLTNLETLGLAHNNLSDISPLSGLTNLARLGLRHNRISDLSPLVANTGLKSGDRVDVRANPLSYHTSVKTHIPALQSRGVTVEFDDTTHLNVGAPRRVRLIYFRPNDRPYRAAVVQHMKDEIRTVQTFYAEQMAAHGYGRKTFRVEIDPKGDPLVHRFDGQHPNSYYETEGMVRAEIEQSFNFNANFYFVVTDTDGLRRNDSPILFRGAGDRYTKNGGYALVTAPLNTILVAHELGHAFGLVWHDFRDGGYIMSYGPGQDRLSRCHAEFLSVHPYFSSLASIEEVSKPSIELLTPLSYPVGAKRMSIQLKVSDLEGLYQVLLIVKTREPHEAAGSLELKSCRLVSNKKEAIVDFAYDGVVPSNKATSLSNPLVHPIRVEVVDTDGNVTRKDFELFSEPLTADVNNDGSVNVLDLILIASDLGNTGANIVTDVSRDGVVNILDIVLVAGMFEGAAAAPSMQSQVAETLTAVEVWQWLTEARALAGRDSIMQRGIIVLEQLLVSLTPTKTELLANYPNPFNPETWIPYRLAEDAFVTLTIYDSNGQVVRALDVRHRIAAAYENRSKAIYWDGRNTTGEAVASGVYFYHLSAGDYSNTRKMLILK